MGIIFFYLKFIVKLFRKMDVMIDSFFFICILIDLTMIMLNADALK